MDFVEQVKSSVDIVRLVGEYVRLKKAGNRYVGLCPFHTEKTPSFGVNPVHQYFKCFGCGAGGDVFKFVMQLEGVTFFEALKTIAERNGIPVPKRSEYSDPDTKQRTALLQAHEIAARLFQSNLNGSMGAHARQYLGERGVTPESIAEFGLGLSADSWDQLTRRLEQEGLAGDLLEHSGLVTQRQEGKGFYDRFRARLMFPIQDESGRVIGFGGRALKADDEPKYLNSPKTSLYDKSNTLYNLHRAKTAIRKLDRVVLVEGYMDVIGVYAAGVHEVVASCGTALTNAQVRALKRHSDRIVVNFDPDTAGASAAERSIQMLLDEDMRVRVLELAGDLDPDEYVKQNGAEAYRKTLEQAALYYFWLADRMRKKFDTRTAEGRMDAWKTILPAIERIRDRIERAAVAKDMAVYLGVDEGLVLERFRKTAAARTQPTSRDIKGTVVPAMEKLLLIALLKSEEARKEILPSLREMESVKRFVTRNIFDAVFAVTAGEQQSLAQAHRDDKTAELLRQSAGEQHSQVPSYGDRQLNAQAGRNDKVSELRCPSPDDKTAEFLRQSSGEQHSQVPSYGDRQLNALDGRNDKVFELRCPSPDDKTAELLRQSSGEQHSQVPSYRDDKTAELLRQSSDVLTFSNLEARLGDADKDLLSRLVFADEGSEENLAVEQARDCMRVLERQDQELRRSNLKSRVQASERSGDLAEALRLSQELGDLEELLRKQRGR